MARVLVSLFIFLLLLSTGAVWFSVSTDRWPWDERRPPASTVWALNKRLGDFLYEHGQDTPEEIAAARPRREGVTAAEKAEIQKVMASDPRFKDRIVLHGGGASRGGSPGVASPGGFRLKPALPVGGRRRG